MKFTTLNVPNGPFTEDFHKLLFKSQAPQIIDKGSHFLYLLEDTNKKVAVEFTTLQLPLFNMSKEDKELFIYKSNYHFTINTQIRYISIPTNQYLILRYFSSKNDFVEVRNGKSNHRKKGDWIITSLNSDDKNYSIQTHKQNIIKELSIFIPTKILKTLTANSPSGSYLKQLTNSETSYLIYESVSTRLKQLFEDINSNRMESLIDIMTFQENIYATLRIIFEQLNQNKISTIKYHFKQGDLEALAKAEKLLLHDIKEPPTIQILANEAAMSSTKFKNMFKKIYGESVYQYFLNYKMELSRQWLLDNKLSISEIAHKLGYKNLSYFSRVFKQHFGEIPSKYTTN